MFQKENALSFIHGIKLSKWPVSLPDRQIISNTDDKILQFFLVVEIPIKYSCLCDS